MRVTHLAGVDLNLLPLLDALLRERHVTRAAARVGLSQPAASRGLGRLRELIGDPLLVRTRAGLALTPRAEALREPLRRALRTLEDSIVKPSAFDPAVARQTVRMVIDEYTALVLMPGLIARVSQAAPGIHVRAVPGDSSFGIEQLVRGDIDFLLTSTRAVNPVPAGVRSLELFSDRLVGMARRGHPLLRGKMTLGRYAAARHGLVAPRGGREGAVDSALAARGKEREVALAIPHFLVMPFVVARSDLVLTIGERLARTCAGFLPVALFTPPVALPRFSVGVFWHEKAEHDPALGWFRAETSAMGARYGRA
jgi:DNA-binding transcriptional LysR family regulator